MFLPDVDAHVEAGVVPIRLVVAAPLAVGVHPMNVVLDLAAVITKAAGVMVYACPIRIEAVFAISPVVSICLGWTAHRQQQSSGQCGAQNKSAPTFPGHDPILPGIQCLPEVRGRIATL